MDPKTVFGDDPWGPATRWTIIREAQGEDAGEAWRELVERYREPIERAVRRQMRNDPASEEVATSFFAYLFENRVLPKVDPEQGRFRCYIQAVLRRYVLHSLRERRPIGAGDDGFDFLASEEDRTLERQEEADWAAAILRHALAKLEEESPRDCMLVVRAYGIPPHEPTDRKELQAEFEMSKQAVDVAIHRARGKLARLIGDEVRQTVASASALNDELEVVLQRLLEASPDLMSDVAAAE